MTADSKLVQRFVNCFARLDQSTFTHADPPPPELSLGPDPNDWNAIRWQPAAIITSPHRLSDLPHSESLPTVYRELALSYRWLSVDLELLRLFGSLPGDGLLPLANLMTSDPVLQNTLDRNGFVRFGLAADGYDPVCFDLNRSAHGDCPIVRLNHEAILTHDKIGHVLTLFNTFRDLMLAVLAV